MENRSCQIHLISLLDEIASLADKGICTEGILRYYKAVDLVPHNILLKNSSVSKANSYSKVIVNTELSLNRRALVKICRISNKPEASQYFHQ